MWKVWEMKNWQANKADAQKVEGKGGEEDCELLYGMAYKFT